MTAARDHGGGVDAAIATYGGTRSEWIDLSTGINPVPYPLPEIPAQAWNALPDRAASQALEVAARRFWQIPERCAVLAAPGASALIARIPGLLDPGIVDIPTPTYNEHAAAFTAHGWAQASRNATAKVIVHPNNPTGHWYTLEDLTAPFMVIDESFADVDPSRSMIGIADQPGRIVLKSFGKFWGLAGLRLGFAIGPQELIDRLSQMLGPWPVSGPAQSVATAALTDLAWARTTRDRLTRDAGRLDRIMTTAGAEVTGGTPLFRLYRVDNAAAWQDRLARHHIWTRVFPYSDELIRLGLPGAKDWSWLEAAL
ncbi:MULTISPECIES: threonine-phosphate decarboxylase [unclassified Roseovarius]|uniref:threonine-phosphate decarboxylase n=1 Tax=unclassified Roseovarius TaxID=2614913 RepID=UPI0027400E52|nr:MULTISPECIES: threonine-phosphate decarboxylase [unclassified Roseovarius]